MGQPIINHQGVAFMLADMAINVEAARGLVWKSAWAKDAGERNSELTRLNRLEPATDSSAFYASMAKACAGQVAVDNANLAVQVFGGAGYNEEMPVAKLLRDSKIYTICSFMALQRCLIHSFNQLTVQTRVRVFYHRIDRVPTSTNEQEPRKSSDSSSPAI